MDNKELTLKILLSMPLSYLIILCHVHTCRFDNQVLNGKLAKKYLLVVKLAQYFVSEVDRNLASYYKQEI